MIANVTFDNVKFYDTKRFNVALGESFKIRFIKEQHFFTWLIEWLFGSSCKPIKWHSINRHVLNINIDSTNNLFATIKAVQTGHTTLQIFEGHKCIKFLQIRVFDDQTVSLNPTAGTPVLK